MASSRGQLVVPTITEQHSVDTAEDSTGEVQTLSKQGNGSSIAQRSHTLQRNPADLLNAAKRSVSKESPMGTNFRLIDAPPNPRDSATSTSSFNVGRATMTPSGSSTRLHSS